MTRPLIIDSFAGGGGASEGIRYGSVCSGIEAATVAWHPLGWRPRFFSEIDAAPRAVLTHHYPKVPLHGDFTTISEGQYGAIDLLVGGTPCQSFSVAGLRGGLADDRGNLALQYLRLAQRLRPRWLVWENVPGVLSSGGGRDFGAILGGMVELGYGFAYRVLDAQYIRVDGFGRAVPQRRRRVFVVGYLGDWRRPAAVLLERASLRGDLTPSRSAGTGIAGCLASRSGGGGWPDGGDGRHDQLVAHSLRGEGFDASEDGTGRGTPIVPVAGTLCFNSKAAGSATTQDAENGMLVAFDTTQITSATNRCNPQDGDPCHPLADGAHPPAIAFSCKDHGADATDSGVTPTLRAMGFAESHANAGGQLAIAQGWAVRRLTPLECERLQGFPDGYTLVPHGRGMMADGPRYKALGNSMAVNAMRWIGTRIQMVEAMRLPDSVHMPLFAAE